MKKAVFSLLVIILVAFSLVVNVSAETGYSFDEVTFEVPDYYIERDYDGSDTHNWLTDDNSAVFRFTQFDNDDSIFFDFVDLDEVEAFYTDFLSNSSDGFSIGSLSDWYVESEAYGKRIDGSLFMGEDEITYETYLFSTNSHVFIFEFFSYGETEYSYVRDIMDTVYIVDYTSFFDNDVQTDDSAEESLGFAVTVIVAVFGLLFKMLGKNKPKDKRKSQNINSIKEKTVDSDFKQEENSRFEEVKNGFSELKDTFTKFELNGKNINSLNERFTVGSKNDNFALKELERERKEREKMFE